MISYTQRNWLKLAVIMVAFASVGASIFYYKTAVKSDPIYNYERVRDHDDIIALFEHERFLLTATPDYSPEFMLRYMSPHNDMRYRGIMKVDVLRPHGVFAGFVTYYMQEPAVGRVLFLAIHQDMRSKGYGKVLIKHAIKKLTDLGAKTVTLVTRTFNFAAQRVYTTVGFTEVSRDEDGFMHYEYKV